MVDYESEKSEFALEEELSLGFRQSEEPMVLPNPHFVSALREALEQPYRQ